MEELFENICHSKRVTVYQTNEGEFLNYDDFVKKFHSDFKGKIKPNHIFSIDENSWATTKQASSSQPSKNLITQMQRFKNIIPSKVNLKGMRAFLDHLS